MNNLYFCTSSMQGGMGNLSTVQIGQKVRIKGIKSSFLRPKLMEMGMLEGDLIQVLFKAPFGDPIAISVKGYTLSLRKDEAALVEVTDSDDSFGN
jgi:ferrous iron transport protein A